MTEQELEELTKKPTPPIRPDLIDQSSINLKPLRARFMLDVFCLNGANIMPLSEPNAKKFCTVAQSETVFKMLPPEIKNAKIVDVLGTLFTIPAFTNYRDDSDPDNLYALAIDYDATYFVKYDDQTGDPITQPAHNVVTVGDLLVQKQASGGTRLVLDKLGQLVWTV